MPEPHELTLFVVRLETVGALKAHGWSITTR
jgi:hypothetical protein